MKSLILALSFVALTSAQTPVRQTNYYKTECFNDVRFGQPIYISATPNPTCEATITNANVCVEQGAPFGYTATVSSCKNITTTPDLTGKIAQYVTLTTFTDTSCSASLTRLDAYAADDLCHVNPLWDKASAGSKFVRANCNGENPYVKLCSDNKCEQCTTSSYVSGCNSNGVLAQCIKNPNLFTGTEDDPFNSASGQSVARAMMGGAVVLAALLL